MGLKKLPTIDNAQLSARRVTKLADRPNLTGQYGQSGMSAGKLKEWFDKLSLYLAGKINDITETFQGEDAAYYIRVVLDGYNDASLGDLINAFQDGTFAENVLLVAKHDGSQGKESLQSVLHNFAQSISSVTEDLTELKEKVNGLELGGGGSGGSGGIILDKTVTENSNNPVTSAGIYKYVQDLLYKAIQITSFSASPFEIEVAISGTAQISLGWALSSQPSSQKLDGSTIGVNLRNTTKSVSISSLGAKSFTLSVTDSKENSDSETAYVYVLNRIYYGASAKQSSYTSAWVRTLTGTLSDAKGRNFNVNAGSGQYIYYAVPERLGTCSFKIGGFAGGFELVGRYQFENNKGFKESYYLYKTVEENLGDCFVEVS